MTLQTTMVGICGRYTHTVHMAYINAHLPRLPACLSVCLPVCLPWLQTGARLLKTQRDSDDRSTNQPIEQSSNRAMDQAITPSLVHPIPPPAPAFPSHLPCLALPCLQSNGKNDDVCRYAMPSTTPPILSPHSHPLPASLSLSLCLSVCRQNHHAPYRTRKQSHLCRIRKYDMAGHPSPSVSHIMCRSTDRPASRSLTQREGRPCHRRGTTASARSTAHSAAPACPPPAADPSRLWRARAAPSTPASTTRTSTAGCRGRM
mmetsp:Transcript_23294/g.66756  ORF Transcript_23294/g.66756 Transcript_23294/m.66756 type:complete len:260 (+) Transcript_23294:293-1072(+)